MLYQKFDNTYVIRLERGDEVVASLLSLAEKEKIALANVSGIGACDSAIIGVYKLSEKKYYSNHLLGDMEITCLAGNITTMDGKPYVHVHATLGMADGSAKGGHLNEAIISATGELMVTAVNGSVDRFKDEASGINFLKL